MDNRLTEFVRKGIDKGENLFFSYGDYIHDLYLYNMYVGVCNMKETYRRFFLNELKYKAYVHLNKSDIIAYIKEGEMPTFFKPEVVEDDLAGLDDQSNNSQNKDEKKKVEQEVEDSAGGRIAKECNALQRLIEIAVENPANKYALLCQDFEWIIGLYKSSNDEELLYVDKIKELAALRNCTIIISMEDVQMLKKYNFNLDGKNVTMIGSPSTEEIYQVYLRRYLRKYDKVKNLKLFTLMEEIAQAIATGEKSLKAALRVFDDVIEHSDGEIKKGDFEKAIDKVIEEKVSLSDVILDEFTKKEIVSKVNAFLNEDDPLKKPKGLILTGPPGTGKTFLVKALANENNCYFMSPTLADLKGEYVGQTSPKVKRLFQKARANAPTIIFIDEADTIFPNRNLAGTGDSDSFNLDMVNQFLVEIDGMLTGEQKVFVVAATNRIEVLDSAIRSRLGEPIEIPLPDTQSRVEMFSKKLENENVDFKAYAFCNEFIKHTKGMSGRDIKKFVENLQRIMKSEGRKLSDYSNTEARTLFFETLSRTEKALVEDLQRELNIEIKNDIGSKDAYNEIIGYENVKAIIDRQMDGFDEVKRRNAEKYGVKPKKGIIMYGPPGNAKSRLAEVAARQHDLYFMKITSETFTKATLVEQNNILVKIFDGALRLSEMCSNKKGVLLFFDEFDAIASRSLLDQRIRGTMLTHLDDKNTLRSADSRVLFMAATNFFDALDDALIRAGRIDDKVEMDNPTKENAIRMIQVFLEQNKEVSKMDLTLIQNVYDRYLNNKKELEKNSHIKRERMEWLSNGATEEMINKYWDMQLKDFRLSGADLKTLVDELIQSAYNNVKINENGKLYIDESVVDEVCR